MSKVIQKIIFACISAAATIVGGIFLTYTATWYYVLVLVAGSLITVAVAALPPKRLEMIYKLALIVAVIYAAYVVLQVTFKIETAEHVTELIRSTGNWGIVVFFLFTLLQIIVLPVPAAVTVVAGSWVFGALVSFLVSTIGTIVGSIICFWLGRTFGKKVVYWMAGVEKTEKYATLLAEKGKFLFILMMGLPFFPDDILCLVAGLSKMRFVFFMAVILLARPLMLAYYAYFGNEEVLLFDALGIFLRVLMFAGIIALLIPVKIFDDRAAAKRKAAALQSENDSGSAEKTQTSAAENMPQTAAIEKPLKE